MMPSFKQMYDTARIGGSYQMQKAVATHITTHPTQKWGIYASFFKSGSVAKSLTLAGPDFYVADHLRGLYSDPASVLEKYVSGLKRRAPDRVSDNNDGNPAILPTAWAAASKEDRTIPNADAIPQDYYGYMVQPLDRYRHWGKPMVDPEELDKYYEDNGAAPDSIPIDVRHIGGRLNPFRDEFERRGEERGYLYRPGTDIFFRGNDDGFIRHEGKGKYAINAKNADIAFEGGKTTGFNGPQGERRAIALLLNQFENAYYSPDRDTRNAAMMYSNYLDYLAPSWYNPRSYHRNGYSNTAIRSPEQVIYPSHGRPGSGFWEETLHGIDNTIGADIGYTADSHLSDERDTIFPALQEDFQTKFHGDPEKIKEHADKIINGWGNPNGGRYADDHEYMELLNYMYRNATGGQSPNHIMGLFANHTRPINTEAFQSLTNGRMNGSKGVERIKSDMPHADKAASELYKEANDHYSDKMKSEKKKPKLALGIV